MELNKKQFEKQLQKQIELRKCKECGSDEYFVSYVKKGKRVYYCKDCDDIKNKESK